MPETTVDIETLTKDVQDFINSQKKEIDDLKQAVGDGRKTDSEAVAELTKVVNAQQETIGKMKEEKKKDDREHLRNSEDILRPQTGTNLDRLTESQLMFARAFAKDAPDNFRNDIDNAFKSIKMDKKSIERHFARMYDHSSIRDLPDTHWRKRNMRAHFESFHNWFQNNYKNDLERQSPGTVPLPGTEIFDYMQSDAVLWMRVPVERKLGNMQGSSGSVTVAAPFPSVVPQVGTGSKIALTDSADDTTEIQLDAIPYEVMIGITDDYINDYTLGSAIDDVMVPIVTDAGIYLDAIVAYGDTGTFNGPSNLATNPYPILRQFDGFGALVDSGTKVDAEDASLSVSIFANAMGILGQKYAANRNNLVLIGSLRQLVKMSNTTGIGDITIQTGNGFAVGQVMNLLGVDMVPVDLGVALNHRDPATGRAEAPVAANKDIAILGNVRALKGGFGKGFGVEVKEVPDRRGKNFIFSFRWAMAAHDDASAVLIHNLAE